MDGSTRCLACGLLLALSGCTGVLGDGGPRVRAVDAGGPMPSDAGSAPVDDDASVPIAPDAGAPPVVLGDGPTITTITPSGTSFTLDVAPGTLGFQLAGTDVWVESLIDPGGRPLYAGGVPMRWPAALIPPTIAQLPIDDDTVAMGLPPGTWSVTLAAPPRGPIDVVAQRTDDGAFHGGRLDLYLYVARGGVLDDERGVTVTAANVLTDYAAGIDDFYVHLSALAGIDRGEVHVIEVDAGFARISGDDHETSAFGVSARTSGPGYHVLLTAGGYERGWSGIASGIPGAQRAGHASSGVLIDVRAHAYFGYVLVHELGHHVGLFHPSDSWNEGAGDVFSHDPLADTNECTRLTDEAGERFLACSEETNFMASYGTVGTGATISASQRALFESAAVYRPYASSPGALRPTPTSLRVLRTDALRAALPRWRRCVH